jgi:hypothetical protein
MEGSRAHPSRIERVPLMAADARPEVVLGGDQPHCGHRIPGPDGSRLLSRAGVAVDYGVVRSRLHVIIMAQVMAQVDNTLR